MLEKSFLVVSYRIFSLLLTQSILNLKEMLLYFVFYDNLAVAPKKLKQKATSSFKFIFYRMAQKCAFQQRNHHGV